MFVELNIEEVLAKMSPKRRAAIKKESAKIKAEIDAAVAAEEANKAGAAKRKALVSSSGAPMAAAPAGK